MKMKKYLHILEDKPLYPVFYDQKRTILSMPPIINSEYTKIGPDTKEIFIDMTGTDLHKMKLIMAVLVSQFSIYCGGDDKFTVEQVKVVDETDGSETMIPDLSYTEFEVEMEYINRILGLELNPDDVAKHCEKMGLKMKNH